MTLAGCRSPGRQYRGRRVPSELSRKSSASLTGGYLSGTLGIPVPLQRRIGRMTRENNEEIAQPEKGSASRKRAARKLIFPKAPQGWLSLIGASQTICEMSL